MNLLNPSEIPVLPDDIILGWDEFRDDLDEDILSDEERITYEGFTNKQRKQEFLTARYLFRELAARMKWPLEEVSLRKEELGKPFVMKGEKRYYVSFSHSRNLVLCALSETKDIGIDLESLQREVNPNVVKRILSENEWKVLGEENPVKLWTMKEAAVKSIGTGLRTNLKDLEMKKNSNGQFTIMINDGKELSGVTFEQLDHCIAVAW